MSKLAILVCAGVLAAAPALAADQQIPDFYANGQVWAVMQSAENNYQGKDFEAPPKDWPGAAGPIGAHPNHPHFGNNVPGQDSSLRIGNDGNPLLLPWASAVMKKIREDIEQKDVAPFDPAARCWPAGVPGVITFLVSPMQFLQTPTEVQFLYGRGQVTRHIYLDKPHSAKVRPSWYGESVGKYVNGDELTVDTIGLTDKAPIDVYNVPHTNKLHVTEHYKFVNDGNRIQLVFTVDDPGAFTQPWSAMKTLLPGNGAIAEALCQVHNDDYFNQGLVPVPTAKKADF